MSNQNQPKSINEKEIDVQKFWEENKIFEKTIDTPAGDTPKGDFSFYDGPPFATGLPHFGHILAGTIKDTIPRYQTMRGKSVRRKWGWDCHGLPIENLIEKKLGLKSKKDIEDFGIDKFNQDAYESVLEYDNEWKKIVPRLGRFVDMSHPYKTMDYTYTESIWWSWKTLFEKGLAYEGSKMMHICPRCETTLAQSEVGMEYHDVTDISVTAEFELVDSPQTYILAWTTTPWTLPGNTALAVNNKIVYVKVKSSFEGKINHFILAKTKVEEYFKDSTSIEIVEEFTGDKLVGRSYKPVFDYFKDTDIEHKENIWKIWHADFITEDSGTGIAHEAPAFGEDDMNLAKANKIPIIKHINMDGTFISSVTDFAGMKVKQAGDTQSADIKIIKWLAHNGKLFEKKKIIHSYPLCWRCKTPLLNYATSSWFVDVPKMKEKLISENQKIGWTPSHIRDGRFGKWLEGAREWAVSRSRYWGAPLPVWKDEEGNIKVVGSLKELADLNETKAKNNYFVIRHGQSVYNTLHKLDSMGADENVLTEEGIKQIKLSAEKIKEFNIDVIISSPLNRTTESAKIIGEITGVAFAEDERLREFNFGPYEGKTIEEFHSLRSIHNNLNERVDGGESFKDLAYRFMSLVCECEKKYSGKKILFVTHGSNAYMGTSEAGLKTDEEIINGDKELTVRNGEIINFVPKIIPRDKTGAINLHRPYIDEVILNIDGKKYKRIIDVFDCWYESGSMPFAQLHYPFENKEIFDKNYPADFIAEGLDQTRGWFYSLINLGVGLFEKAPYKHVIVSGMAMAGNGKKMSKSEKNYTDPMILVESYGADALRYTLLSSPLIKGENVNFADDDVSEVYKKIILRTENIITLYKMNEEEQVVSNNNSSNILDRWIIGRIHELINSSTKGYESYLLDEAIKGVDLFVDDLSVWYVRRVRDRLKGDIGEEEKKLSYETLKYVLLNFAKVIAPPMPFLSERIYKEIGGEKESVHLESWPKGGEVNDVLNKEMKEVREIVSSVLMKRTESKIGVRQPLASITVTKELSDEYKEIIKDEVNVKEIFLGEELKLDTNLNDELIKEGELRNLMRQIQDKRKERGLSPKDLVKLNISIDENHFGKVFNEQLRSVCKISEINWGALASEDKEVKFEIV